MLRECLLAGLACNDALITDEDGKWTAVGDPTEAALVVSARKAGLEPGDVPLRLDVLPFTSDRRYMATLHPGGLVYLKGAVERILDFAGTSERTQAGELADSGLRVLAIAAARLPQGVELTEEALRGKVVLLGLQAMHDRRGRRPSRPCKLAVLRVSRSG